MEQTRNIALERQIDSVCGDFKELLRNTSDVSLEEYLARTSDTIRPQLLVKLILIEAEHRRAQGEVISVLDYSQRFPQAENEIRDSLQHLLDSEANPDLTVTATFDATPADLTPTRAGENIGRYELLSHLGTGGFGQVWSSRDPLLNRVVAVKIRRNSNVSGDRLGSFLAEGKRLAQLDHEGIVRVLDAGISGQNAYLVSEFMPGGTLREQLDTARVSTETVVSWISQVARALHHAHVRGFVHRDIKPSNILFDEHDCPHLADFGIAASEEELVRESPGIVGTVQYMSPEQAGGQSNLVDPRSDVYCLGLVLYRALTGRLPFTASRQSEYLQQILDREPRPLRSIRSSIPQELEAICLKALQRSINQRFGSALEFAETLEDWQKSPPKPGRGRPWSLLVAACLALLAVAVIAAVRRTGSEPSVGLVSEASKSVLETCEVVAWTPYDTLDEYGYDEQDHQFHFDAFGHALFSAESVQGQAVDLRVTLSIRRWKGLGGVFWELRRAADGTSKCRSVMVGRYRDDQPFRVEICEFSIGPVSGGRDGVQSEAVLWWTPATLPKGDDIELRVSASNNTVSQIWINEQAILQQPFLLPNKEKRDFKTSATGFCGHLGEFSVSSFSVD